MARLLLESMTVEEKLELMEQLWADLSSRSDVELSPAWHRDVLAEREEALKRGEEEILDWEDAKGRIEKEIS